MHQLVPYFLLMDRSLAFSQLKQQEKHYKPRVAYDLLASALASVVFIASPAASLVTWL